MIGYHFVGATLRDGRPVPPDGVWLEHEGPVKPCVSGLHLSKHPFDALQYAPGSTLCLDVLEGDIQTHGYPIDKWAGRRRKIIRRIDATHLLRRFAADQALGVAHLWNMPERAREYLMTLDESTREAALEAAREAALEAARAAALEATRAAAGAAAWAAAWEAAWESAREAACEAARAWAGAAAWAAGRAAARDDFARRVEELLPCQP